MILYNLGLKVVREDPSILAVIGHHSSHITKPRLDVKKELGSSVCRHRIQAAVLFPDTEQISLALTIAQDNANLMPISQNPNKQGLKLLGESTLYRNTTLKKGGEAVEGLIIAIPWFSKIPQAKNFTQAAKKQWGEQEMVNWETATSFDATQAFIKALSINPDRNTVLQRLPKVELPANETSGYPLKFTTQGERETEPILVTVEGGKFKLVR